MRTTFEAPTPNSDAAWRTAALVLSAEVSTLLRAALAVQLEARRVDRAGAMAAHHALDLHEEVVVVEARGAAGGPRSLVPVQRLDLELGQRRLEAAEVLLARLVGEEHQLRGRGDVREDLRLCVRAHCVD